MAPRFPLIFLYALILFLIPHAAQAQSAERAGEVAEINRSGLQLHAGRTAWLDQGDDVIRFARLETDNVGEMALAMDDGSHLVLMPNSDIQIDRFVYDPDQTTGEAVFSLGRGALRMVSGRLPSGQYRVNTPVATIGLRGTDFTAEMTNGAELLVRVDEGAVEILPVGASEPFVVRQGQVGRCTASGCEDVASDANPVRHARLGPPAFEGDGQGGNGAGTAGSGTQVAARGGVTGGVTAHGSAAQAAANCPPFRIPADTYRRVGLDPTPWPASVPGITTYRHSADGPVAKHYCPRKVAIATSRTGFSIMGEAAPGDEAVLYYVNAFEGQDLFAQGFNARAKEKSDAKAYKGYMARVFEDEPRVRVVDSKADLDRAGQGQLVLRQKVRARGKHGEYVVTGVTLYQPVSDGRTALFGIPAVVTPRRSETAETAADIAREIYRQLPEGVAFDLRD